MRVKGLRQVLSTGRLPRVPPKHFLAYPLDVDLSHLGQEVVRVFNPFK